MRSILNIILILILVSACYAFEPQKHKSISNRGVCIYEACTGHAIPEELSSAFAKGALDEDEIGLTRLLNWHFYNNDKKLGHYWKFIFYCNGSNERIFRKRLDKLEAMFISKTPKRDIYAQAGRVAHHIQDMSSPPHVMPIYHIGRDKFDGYEYEPRLVSVVDTTAICTDISESVVYPLELLERAAQNTLKAVRNPVVFKAGITVENETWMKFWGGPEDKELSGFKTYGEYGNVFGTIPPCKNGVCCLYQGITFDKFYNECYLRSVTDTIRLLIYLDQRIQEMTQDQNRQTNK